jgi:hypothetical protein
VSEPLAVEVMDRSELIAALRELEQQKGVWELRIEACAEREELCRDMVNQCFVLVNNLFKREQVELSNRADGALNLVQQMHELLRKADML